MFEKLVNLVKPILQYSSNQTSKKRMIIFTILMVSLYFLFYVLLKNVFYSIVKIDNKFSYIYIFEIYFLIFYFISTLPIFLYLFFKFNILTNFWNKVEKPHLIDYLFFGVIILFLYFSFNHGDITATSVHGKVLLDMVWKGKNILEFYDINQGTAAYLLPQYIIFGIWSIPVKIVYFILGLSRIGINEVGRIRGFTLWWYKLLPTLFYVSSAFLIYKIGLLLQMDKNKAKWMSFIFLTFPMAVFSQFIFGQYDIIGVFFELIMIYFFLQKKLLKASLICMIAVTFKVFPIFIFLPLILLYEKKVFKIIGYTIISFSGYLFFNLLFSGSEMFKISNQFNNGMFQRLFSIGIGTNFGNISFFIFAFFAVCIFAYFINIEDKDELTIQKYILYIPLFVYSVFFSFVLYHPQWILVLVPYLVINIFLNKNTKGMMFIAIGTNIGFLFTTMSLWTQNVDANMINLGIFPRIFGFFNSGENFKSLNKIASFSGKIPSSLYLTLFVGMILISLIIAYPNKKNIYKSKNIIQSQFAVERDVIWINGLIVLLFAIPSILLFFTQDYILINKIDSELFITKDIEILKQNTNDIKEITIIDNNVFLKCGTNDPQLYIKIQNNMVSPGGLPFFEITYMNSERGLLQFYFDYGKGFSEYLSSTKIIEASNTELKVLLPIVGWEKGTTLVGIRIDPPQGSEFMIKKINLGYSQKIQKDKK